MVYIWYIDVSLVYCASLVLEKPCVLWGFRRKWIYSASVHLKRLHFILKQHNLDRNREVLPSGFVPLGLILLLAESGALSLTMSVEAKWSNEVVEFWAAGLSGMNCCPLEMAEPPPFTALGLCHQYSFRCHREAVPGFWQETLPHTHFRLFPSFSFLSCEQKLCQESTFIWARNRGSWYSASHFDCLAGRGWRNR